MISTISTSISPGYVCATQADSGLGGHGGDRFYTLRMKSLSPEKWGLRGTISSISPRDPENQRKCPPWLANCAGEIGFGISPGISPKLVAYPQPERKPA